MNNFNVLKKHTENKNSGENTPYPDDWFGKKYSKLSTQGLSSTSDERANTMAHNVRKNFSKDLISQYNLAPQSQIATQSNDYEKFSYDGSNLRSDHTKDDILKSFSNKKQDQTHYHINKVNYNNASKVVSNFTTEKNKQLKDLKPITEIKTTTENTLDALRNNIFLKRFLIQNKTKFGDDKHSSSMHSYKTVEDVTKKSPKTINSDYNNYNDIIFINRKPQNAADIFNFVSLKDAFESTKINPKKSNNNEWPNSDINTKHDSTYIQTDFKSSPNDYSYPSDDQDERLRGIVKIYKSLHRNNNIGIERKDRGIESRKDTSTDLYPLPSNKLPPLGMAGPSVRTYSPPSYV
ncbi:hypothetical protein EVAR_63391_1 [Eumeta japonica]|uniref:Uncharacterized protein n=1 Tax=Eumeta variegata TaxID=151549 RepID=A0A4C1Z387_EUMVA|nr:hypothetical protein EVAR_63391_1 [Eumeta japonica]